MLHQIYVEKPCPMSLRLLRVLFGNRGGKCVFESRGFASLYPGNDQKKNFAYYYYTIFMYTENTKKKSLSGQRFTIEVRACIAISIFYWLL
jgi:hypothetical protein